MVKATRSRQFPVIFQQKKKGSKSKGINENGELAVSILTQTSEQVKRSAEMSPQDVEAPSRKRSAFGDITNAVHIHPTGKAGKDGKAKPKVSSKTKSSQPEVVRKEKKSSEKKSKSAQKAVPDLELLSSSSELSSSQESTSSMESSYDTISSDLSKGELINDCQETGSKSSTSADDVVMKALDASTIQQETSSKPDDVIDIDANKADPFMVADYAEEIFLNMKAREELFPLKSYMDDQKELTVNMRAILVDWLVEVQESFELYHETLYLGVKIMDSLLMRCFVERENLQLIGAASLFIACKIEERHPPCLDDFLYICDDAYQQSSFVAMERKILSSLEFDINIPIPYRFLRRFARAASANVETLTLARFILETTLHTYEFLEHKPSFLAAGCLCLSLMMKSIGTWTPTLVHYTGYTKEQLKDCVIALNDMISQPPKKNLMTVRNKYSHKVFHEVANIPPLDFLTFQF